MREHPPGLSRQAVAHALGLSEARVAQLERRALAKCRRALVTWLRTEARWRRK